MTQERHHETSASAISLAQEIDVHLPALDEQEERYERVRPAQAAVSSAPTSSASASQVFVERRWVPYLLAGSDALVLALVLGMSVLAAVAAHGWPLPGAYVGQVWLSLGLLLTPLALGLAGLYPGYGLSPVERLRRRVGVTALLVGVLAGNMITLSLAVPWGRLSLVHLLVLVAGALVVSPLVEAMLRAALVRCRWWGTPAVILGGGHDRRLVEALEQNAHLGLRPIRVVESERPRWRENGEAVAGVPVLTRGALARRATEVARVAVLSQSAVERGRALRLARRLGFPRIIVVPDLSGLTGLSTHGIEAQDLGGVLGLEVRRNLLLRRNLVLKRVFDCVVGSVLLLMSLPVLVVLGLWVKWTSPGPALYAHERVGCGGRKIRVWKLRTMCVDADGRLREHLANDPDLAREWSERFKLRDDPRILPGVGHLLRETSLDELPQLWNVVKGDMSLVGPRPFPAYHLQSFRRDFRAVRQSVLPGLTGLWQVSSRSDGGLEVQQTLDTYYIRNWSIWLDLHLLGRTVSVVLRRCGAY